MDDTLRIAAIGIGAPLALGVIAGVAGAARSGARTTDAGRPAAAWPHVLSILVLTIAMLVSLWGVTGSFAWPPADSTQRLFLVPPIAAAIGVLIVLLLARRTPRVPQEHAGVGLASGVAALLAAAAGVLIVCGKTLVSGSAEGSGGAIGVAWVPVAMGVFGGLAAGAVDRIVRHGAGGGSGGPTTRGALATAPATAGGARVSGSIVLVGLAAATGAGLMGNGSMVLGQIGFGLAAACAGLVAGALARRSGPSSAAIGLACAMMAVLLASGRCYAELPWWSIGVLACAAPAALAVDRLMGARGKGVKGAAARIAAAAIVALIAVGPGVWSLIQFVLGTGGGGGYTE